MTKEPNAHNYFNGRLKNQIERDLKEELDGDPGPTFVVGSCMTIQGVLDERGKRYAKFIDNASVAQDLKSIVHNSKNYLSMKSDQQEALDMICSKISRMVTGEAEYEDNLVDIIGYSQLVLDRIRQDKK